jgi:uncharacterized protein YqeY
MTLLQQLKADSLTARKARDAATAASLTTLIGELETASKNSGHEPTDAEVTAAIKKTLKNIGESLEALKFSSDGRVLGLMNEQKLFTAYLPKQLDEAELRSVVGAIIVTGAKTMGDVMKALKAQHDGQYDGKLASTVIKDLLA